MPRFKQHRVLRLRFFPLRSFYHHGGRLNIRHLAVQGFHLGRQAIQTIHFPGKPLFQTGDTLILLAHIGIGITGTHTITFSAWNCTLHTPKHDSVTVTVSAYGGGKFIYLPLVMKTYP